MPKWPKPKLTGRYEGKPNRKWRRKVRNNIPQHPMKFNALKAINDEHPNSDEFMVAIHQRTDHLLTTLYSREEMKPEYIELFCSTLGRIGCSAPSDMKREMHDKFVGLMKENNRFYTTIARFLLQQQENHASKLLVLESLAAFITSDGITSDHPFITALRLYKLQGN